VRNSLLSTARIGIAGVEDSARHIGHVVRGARLPTGRPDFAVHSRMLRAGEENNMSSNGSKRTGAQKLSINDDQEVIGETA
jgi:hypothetical protein